MDIVFFDFILPPTHKSDRPLVGGWASEWVSERLVLRDDANIWRKEGSSKKKQSPCLLCSVCVFNRLAGVASLPARLRDRALRGEQRHPGGLGVKLGLHHNQMTMVLLNEVWRWKSFDIKKCVWEGYPYPAIILKTPIFLVTILKNLFQGFFSAFFYHDHLHLSPGPTPSACNAAWNYTELYNFVKML